MAPTLDRLLQQRATEVAPTTAQRDAAGRSEKYLRDLLDTGQFKNRILDSFLIGSYARHTALRPLDDVDIVFIVDPSPWQTGWQDFRGSLPAPNDILQSFAAAVRYRYQESSVHVQTRSVGLKMHHLDIDVVPAVVHPKNPAWICVPDRKAGKWIDSGPGVHSAVVTSINQRLGGRLLLIIRLLKAWNDRCPSTAQLKGFAIETLATRLFEHHDVSSLSAGLRMFFDFVARLGGHEAMFEWRTDCGISFSSWGRSLPDVAGTGSNLLANADHERVTKFALGARVTRDAVDAAMKARSPDLAWRQLEVRFPK